MAYSAPSTRSSGDALTSTIWNSDVVANPIAINAGAVAIASQTSGDIITATSSTQLGRTPNISVAQGGTGVATLTANSLLLGAGTSDVTFAAPGSSGNVLTSNGTVWASAAASAGATTLLVADSGTSTNTSAHLFDTVAISGLSALDTLLVYVDLGTATQSTAGIQIYNSTDSVVMHQYGTISVAEDPLSGWWRVRQDQAGATSINTYRSLGWTTGATTGVTASTFSTDWTGSWTLAIRTTGVVSGGTCRWSWAVFKLAGQ